MQILAALCTAGMLAADNREVRPEKFWRGATAHNTNYDWLRPPDDVLQRAISEAYDGKTTFERSRYRYAKRKILFGESRIITAIWLDTPLVLAVLSASTARERFEPKPTVADTRRFLGKLLVSIAVETYSKDDLPYTVIRAGDRTFRPVEESVVSEARTSCVFYAKVKCWSIGKVFLFEIDKTDRLSGKGTLILRWQDLENRLPVSFAHLW